MKVMLISFNIQEDIFPLGLMYLKSYAEEHGTTAEIIAKEFSYGNRFTYDVNKNIEQQILSYFLFHKPDIIAFSSYIWSIEIIKQLSRSLKFVLPNVKILLGNVEATKDALGANMDFIMSGESEISFLEFLEFSEGKKLLSEVTNLSYIDSTDLLITNSSSLIEDLDDIPFPYRYYPDSKINAVRIETSRGCPYNCNFCNYAERSGMRYFSLSYLKKNIAYLFDHYDFKNLTLLDANFNINVERMKNILEIIS